MLPRPVRIFVVDDEPVIAHSLAMILRSMGYQASSYMDPSQAWEQVNVEPPDLIISDVHMPVMSGLELVKRIRADIPGCKILLFSAHAQTDDLLQDTEGFLEGFPLIAKPVHPAVLLAEVKRLLAEGS